MSTDSLLSRLLELICDLYADSDGFLEQTDDVQRWYNRGYANGVIEALDRLGFARQVVDALEPDAADMIRGHELLPWGKAYLHGRDKGREETFEVMEKG